MRINNTVKNAEYLNFEMEINQPLNFFEYIY